jgi:hypothetical protein
LLTPSLPIPVLAPSPIAQSPEHEQGITRAKTYVQGSDKDVLCGFFVSSINEWKVAQPRVIVISRTAYYRVTYSQKHGRIDHYQKTALSKLRVFEKTPTGLKVYTTDQDGNVSLGKRIGSWFSKKEKDEFEHAREYLPTLPMTGGSVDLLVDAMAAVFHKAAELCSAALPPSAAFTVPHILGAGGKKQVVADRKEAARLEAERIEREGATEELEKAMEGAKESRDFGPLGKPMKRAKKAVGVDQALLDAADALLKELEEEKRERELQERLAREKEEREGAQEELNNAMTAATESRDFSGLAKPIKRAKKAVDFPADELAAAEALVKELEEEKKEKERQEREDARLAAEKEEREGAQKELATAMESAQTTRDGAPPAPEDGGAAAMGSASKQLDKPIKRAKKAVEFPADELAAAEALKKELDELKTDRDTAERLEKERIEREAATAELEEAIEKCEESRDPKVGLVKAIKRAKKAVDVSTELIGKGEALKTKCDEEKAAAEAAAKAEKADAAAAAKADAAAKAAAAKAEAAQKAAAEAEAKAATSKAVDVSDGTAAAENSGD